MSRRPSEDLFRDLAMRARSSAIGRDGLNAAIFLAGVVAEIAERLADEAPAIYSAGEVPENVLAQAHHALDRFLVGYGDAADAATIREVLQAFDATPEKGGEEEQGDESSEPIAFVTQELAYAALDAAKRIGGTSERFVDDRRLVRRVLEAVARGAS